MTKTAIGIGVLLVAMACGEDDPRMDAAVFDSGTDGADSAVDSAPVEDGGTEFPLYAQPESVVWDEIRDVWYVSNIAGESTATDGLGWIVQLDQAGEVLNARWVSGLNAPKGLALLGDFLYVADLTELIQINIADGAVVSRIACPDAVFLNDVTTDGDTIYVSDTFGGSIYRWRPGDETAAVWVRDPMLGAVNGLVVDGENVIAGTIGDFMDLEDLGHLLSIDRTDGTVTLVASEVAKFDGLVVDGEGYLATDFRGRLLRLSRDGVATLVDDLTMSASFLSAADLGFDAERRLAAIPDLFGSRVVLLNVP